MGSIPRTLLANVLGAIVRKTKRKDHAKSDSDCEKNDTRQGASDGYIKPNSRLYNCLSQEAISVEVVPEGMRQEERSKRVWRCKVEDCEKLVSVGTDTGKTFRECISVRAGFAFLSSSFLSSSSSSLSSSSRRPRRSTVVVLPMYDARIRTACRYLKSHLNSKCGRPASI